MDIKINAAAERNRYEIAVDGKPAGFTEYERRGDVVAFLHTEIDPEFSGKGLAGKLIRYALDDVRDQELSVLPLCPFVRAFITKHEDYVDLVRPADRPQFDLR